MDTLALHCRAYNALLEEHRRRYETAEPAFNFTAMCREITSWRGRVEALDNLNAQSLQVTAKRANLAFEAFFRRVKAGDTAGYPRFKSLNRFTGWGYKTYGDGWKLRTKLTNKQFTYDRLHLTGVGDMRIRGQGRFVGSPKTCEVLHRKGQWHLSVTFDVAEHRVQRPTGTQVAAFDWGVKTLLTIVQSDGTKVEVENPRWLTNQLGAIKALQRAISVAETAISLAHKQPVEWKIPPAAMTAKLKRLYAQLRAVHGKLARQRKDFYHKLTTRLVEQYAFLGTEELAVKKMTQRPDKVVDAATGEALPNGAQKKARLNRGILDAAPSMLLGLLGYKAEEAGNALAMANTRVVKPTQRCHKCGVLVPKTLDERTHQCTCGCVCDRDENAAKTILRWMLEGPGWFKADVVSRKAKEPSKKRCTLGTSGGRKALETPPIAAIAV